MTAETESRSTPVQGLGRKMAAGAAWMVLIKFAQRGLGLISTIILARLLVPDDFGLIAMATSLAGVLEIMGAFSFDLALIQNQRAERRHYDTAWTFNVLYGTTSAAILAAIAVPAASFFSDPRLEHVVYVLALAGLVQSFENIGVVAFRKELDFRREFNFLLLKKLVAFTVTIAFALWFRSYWALVLGMLASRVAGVGLSFLLHPYRPGLSFAALGELWRFSGWLLLNNLLVFAGGRGYDFIIGRVAGAHALGLYSIAHEISNLPTTELVWPVSRAIFPGFSKISNDLDQLRKTFLHVSSLVALVTFPIGIGIAVLAEPLVRLLLGAKWIAAVPLIQILSIYGVTRAMHAGTGAAYLAVGRPRVLAIINLPHVLVGWPLMFVLLREFGIDEAAWAVLVASLIAVAINFSLAVKVLELRIVDLLGSFLRPTVAVALMLIAETTLLQAWAPSAEIGTLLIQTAVYVAAGAIAYTGVLLLLWVAAKRPDGAEKLIFDRLIAIRFSRTSL